MPRSGMLEHARLATRQTHDVLRAWVEIPRFERFEQLSKQVIATGDAQASSLHGLPIAVKDVIDVAGFPTRAGSRSRDGAPAASRDAQVVAQLSAQGAFALGKATTTEFAYLDPPETTNPFAAGHTPGGSSSGSAALVGAGVVPLALGTQTAGSVCRPAAFCGAYAYKPSTGRTAPEGVTPFAPSFDTVGVMGLDLGLVADAGEALIGPETANRADASPAAVDPNGPLRIGLIADGYYQTITAECRRQLERVRDALRQDGHIFEDVRFDADFESLRDDHRLMMHVEAYRCHAGLLDQFESRLRPHWSNALRRGALTTEEDYRDAASRLSTARSAMLEKLRHLDLVLLPPTFATAPKSIGATGDAGLIVPWTYIGSPLVVMPTALSAEGLPLAVMFAGLPGSDRRTLQLSRSIGAMLRKRDIVIDRPR